MSNILTGLGMLLGGAWATGINLYLTVAILGLADRFGFITLPGNLDVLAHPLVIIVAILLYLVEFFADKIPYVDSTWDTIHTAIRPTAGLILGFLALSNSRPEIQFSLALLCGIVALDAHLTKATTRVAINTSPEPVTNTIASVSEDTLVVIAIWLIIKHPIIAGVLVISFIVFSIWFLKTMFRFLKKMLGGFKNDEKR